MANEIISYIEMCQREGASLQRGMNFGLGGGHSVILMSLRPNAPYQDELIENGSVLEPVSKIPQHDFHTAQPHHSEEILDVIFPAVGQAAIDLQPCKQPLNGPASPIAA